MSQEANKTWIGIFVVAALALLVFGVLILGGKSIFNQRTEYVMYFDESVSGLSVGAPVLFRGVQLGQVTKINFIANSRTESVTIPVHVAIDDSSLIGSGVGRPGRTVTTATMIKHMIQRGMRAQLGMQSFITGQYRIELDFYPESPARYMSGNREREIPTRASPLGEIRKRLSNLPLDEITAAVQDALHGIVRLTNNEDIPLALAAIKDSFQNLSHFIASSEDLRRDAGSTLKGLSRLSVTLDRELPEAVRAFSEAAANVSTAAAQLRKTMGTAEGVVSKDSRTVRDLNNALEELVITARAIRNLANMLERNPEALLRGKAGGR